MFQEAVSRFDVGKYHEAELRFRWVIDDPLYLVQTRFYLGRIAKKRGDCKAALEHFAIAKEYDKSKKISASLFLEEKTECEVMLADVPSLPTLRGSADARVAFEDGKDLFEAKEYIKAMAFFAKAIEFRPEDAHVHYYLGLTHGALRNEEKAIRYLLLAKYLDPRLSFTTPETYYQYLAQFQVRLHSPSIHGDTVRFFNDPVIDEALFVIRPTKDTPEFLIKDLSSKQTTPVLKELLESPIKQFVKDHQKYPLLLLFDEHSTLDPNAIADALWEIDVKHRENLILLVGAPDGIAIRAKELSASEGERMAESAILAADDWPTRFQKSLVLLSDQYDHHFNMNLFKVLFVIGLFSLLVGLGGMTFRTRRTKYQSSYEGVFLPLEKLFPEAAERLARARMTLISVPDGEVEDHLESGEQLFFHAREIKSILPKPSERRLPQTLAEEGLLALEEAIRRAKRAQKLLDETPAKLQKELPRALGCFFCARPVGAPSGGYRTRVRYRKLSHEFLVCRPCARAIDCKKIPDVKMILRKNRRRHWSQTRAFVPGYNFYQPGPSEEIVPASEAWSELFGDDETINVFDHQKTLTSMPILAALPDPKGPSPNLAFNLENIEETMQSDIKAPSTQYSAIEMKRILSQNSSRTQSQILSRTSKRSATRSAMKSTTKSVTKSSSGQKS